MEPSVTSPHSSAERTQEAVDRPRGDGPSEATTGAANFLHGLVVTFRYHQDLADRAIRQVSDGDLFRPLDHHTNSIAVNMRHIAGNLRSRWTDFLTSDGEKPWRNRDDEFADPDRLGRADLLAEWGAGWQCLFDALQALTPADVTREVTIRGERLSVPLAAQRSLAHTAYHVGHIVLIARIHAGERWTTLTIPRGASRQHNARVWGTAQYAEGSSAQAAGRIDPEKGAASSATAATDAAAVDRAMTDADAWALAREWIDGWNARDLDRVLAHYADDFIFRSPLALALGFGHEGVLRGKAEVRPYWEHALSRHPDLRLRLINVLRSVNGMSIHYASIGGRECIEVLQFGVDGRVTQAAAFYAAQQASAAEPR